MGNEQARLDRGPVPPPNDFPTRPPRPRRRLRHARRNIPYYPGNLRHSIRYTQEQREYAINLMQMGFNYRETARMTAPYCSCSTTYRWRQKLLGQGRNRRIWQSRR